METEIVEKLTLLRDEIHDVVRKTMDLMMRRRPINLNDTELILIESDLNYILKEVVKVRDDFENLEINAEEIFSLLLLCFFIILFCSELDPIFEIDNLTEKDSENKVADTIEAVIHNMIKLEVILKQLEIEKYTALRHWCVKFNNFSVAGYLRNLSEHSYNEIEATVNKPLVYFIVKYCRDKIIKVLDGMDKFLLQKHEKNDDFYLTNEFLGAFYRDTLKKFKDLYKITLKNLFDVNLDTYTWELKATALNTIFFSHHNKMKSISFDASKLKKNKATVLRVQNRKKADQLQNTNPFISKYTIYPWNFNIIQLELLTNITDIILKENISWNDNADLYILLLFSQFLKVRFGLEAKFHQFPTIRLVSLRTTIALLYSSVLSFFDVGTDIFLAFTYIINQEYMYGILTLLIVGWSSLFIAVESNRYLKSFKISINNYPNNISKVQKEVLKYRETLKSASDANKTEKMLESKFQLMLQLFIIFTTLNTNSGTCKPVWNIIPILFPFTKLISSQNISGSDGTWISQWVTLGFSVISIFTGIFQFYLNYPDRDKLKDLIFISIIQFITIIEETILWSCVFYAYPHWNTVLGFILANTIYLLIICELYSETIDFIQKRQLKTLEHIVTMINQIYDMKKGCTKEMDPDDNNTLFLRQLIYNCFLNFILLILVGIKFQFTDYSNFGFYISILVFCSIAQLITTVFCLLLVKFYRSNDKFRYLKRSFVHRNNTRLIQY